MQQPAPGLPELLRTKFYTVLILPHARSRFRKLHLSRGFVVSLGLLAGTLVLGGLALPQLLLRMQTQALEVDWLKYENQSLRRDKERFEAALSQVSEQLEVFEVKANRLAQELEVEPASSGRPAAGGAGLVKSLRLRSDHLDRSLAELDTAFQERARLLSQTPSMMPVNGSFSHSYGWRKDPFTGKPDFHSGVDIVAPTGTEVVAPADALVARVGTLSAYGKSIDLVHGQGFATRYGHLSQTLVKPGDRLKKGDLIGRVGSTGRSTGPHLHYEVFRNGRTVNPGGYLGQKQRANLQSWTRHARVASSHSSQPTAQK